MTTQIRSKVFETNSSSSHSLVIANTGDLLPIPFADIIMEAGTIGVTGGEYGWEIDSYHDVYSKMSYLFTDAMMTDNDIDFDSNYKLKLLHDAIIEHTGVELEVLPQTAHGWYPYGYIDHQSVGICNEVWDLGVEGVKQFLFNSDSYFETDNDNH